MTRFVVIDPSLQRPGGHDLEYALHLLDAARRAGYEVFLATHRGFPNARRASMDWPVFPVFRYSHYRTGQSSTMDRVSGIGVAPKRDQFRHLWRHFVSRWQLAVFLGDCDRLFRSLPLAPGDLVFLPMVTAFEVAALIRFLARNPWTLAVSWCVQFHYPPLRDAAEGGDHGDEKKEGMRNCFSGLQAAVPGHRLRFFATTERLAAQYRLLGLRDTRSLPYPPDPAITPVLAGAVPSTLNLVLAGHLRREKGPHLLAGMMAALWHDFLASGRVHLWLQGRPGRIRRLLPRRMRPFLSEGDPAGRRSAFSPVRWVAHPLSTAAYRELILNAQIGVMLYDQRAYHARCSGALVEFLCAGVPVVVPAGTWLADQIAEPIYHHHESILGDSGGQGWVRGVLSPQTDAFDGPDIHVGGPHGHRVTGVEIPSVAKALIVQFSWDTPDAAGVYLRLDAELSRDGDKRPSHASVLLGHRAAGPVSAMFLCSESVETLQLTWSAESLSAPIRLHNVRLFFLTRDSPAMPPLGAVGLIAADAAHAADCVADIVEHYSHYRSTALHFSTAWRRRHSPQALVRALEEARLWAPEPPPVDRSSEPGL